MKNKKLVTIALTAAFAVGISAPVFADVPALIAMPAADAAATTETQQVMSLITSVGTVQEINEEGNYASVLVKTAQDEIEFYVNQNAADSSKTWLVDGATGTPIALKDLKGKEVVVAHSQAMTMSLPPKCNAKAIMVQGDVGSNYAVIEKVVKNNDGTVTLTTDNGSRLVTVGKDAVVTPFKTRNIVTMDMLKAGDEVVLYYDVMALSYPAQAYTNRVVLLQPGEETAVAGGATVQETAMVSLRDAANELGLAIDWNAETQTAILSKGAFSVTATVGSADYGINKMLLKLDQAAEIRDGRTYVPQALVDEVKAKLGE